MNRAFSPSLVRPNLPLRRPATGPGLVIRNPNPVFNDLGLGVAQELPQTTNSLDAEANKKENGAMAVKGNAMAGPLAAPVMLNLCNYCSQQGNLRCTGCRKTCYCSVACQSEDWKAHRHLCKPCKPENSASDKSKECLTSPYRSGPTVLEINNNVVKPKRVFLRDLRKSVISKGDELQGAVVELRNPGKFFIHIQSVEMAETLRTISLELQKTYGSSHAVKYIPEAEELCAVKFSLDQNWYRGHVESVDLDRQTAKILYIDFGNEEEVTFDQICSLAENIDLAPACALQCCVAGVKSVTSVWAGECFLDMRQLVAEKNLTFIVMDTLNNGTLIAVDFTLPTLGKNLSTILIDRGYAMKEDMPTKLQTDSKSLLTAPFENFKRLSFGKIENIEAQPPEPLTQGVGDTFTAVVTHLQSPSEIICQKLENASAIQQLQLSLREHCTKTPTSVNFRPAPGTVCCSLFSGTVLLECCFLLKDTVLIYLRYLGHTILKDQTLRNQFSIAITEDKQWYRAKVLAYSSEDLVCVGYIDFGNSEEVQLNHLQPISLEHLTLAAQAIPCALAGIKPSSDTWSEEVTLMLKRLVCNRFIQVEILGERDGMALVSMVDESSDPQTNAAEMLVAAGYAALGDRETKQEAAKDISENPVVKLEWTCAELPIDGQEVELVISGLQNPGEFYCYDYSSEADQTLGELSLALTRHCETAGTPFNPAVGEPCCALFSDDGRWYRAMLQSVEADGKARVYFVDYGNSCEIEMTHLRAITPSLLKLPFQAIRCHLAGIDPVGGQWKEAAVKKFQALCVGNQLKGRVVTITERGYGMELRYNGQNIAAVLVSEQLARPLGPESNPQQNGPQGLKAASPAQMSVPSENPSRAEQPANVNRQGTASAESVASFPLDWKTMELPLGATFQPQVAALTSPSLFYVMNPRAVNTEVLQAVMTDVAKYCSRQTESSKSVPLPGAACCAQFSGDKKWYRAVVLDTTNTHANVIYADYGNCEKLPISCILPIPKELLKHPFQIARCALSGKEHFPTVWPPEVLELFVVQVRGQIMITVQDFDGTFNLLKLTQSLDKGGNSINSCVLEALRKRPEKATGEELSLQKQVCSKEVCSQEGPQAGSASMAAGHASSDTEKPNSESQDMEKMSAVKTSVENKELQANTGSKGISSGSVSSCCCDALKQKLDHIEELLVLLVKQNAGNQK